MNDYIKKRHFRRSLICQPYFIWHSLKDGTEPEENFEDDSDLAKLFWEVEPEEVDEKSYAGQVIARTFRLIDEKLMENFKNHYDAVFLKGSVDERIERTKKLIGSGKMIVNGVFEFEGAIANPFAFDDKAKAIINIKYSMKTNKNVFADFYYDYQIIAKTTDVNDCILYLPLDKDNYKKGEIELVASQVSGYKNTAIDQVKMSDPEYGKNILETVKGNSMFPNNFFENQLDKIKKAFDVKEISSDLGMDITFWGFNPEWNELLLAIHSYLAGYSGKVFKKPPKGTGLDGSPIKHIQENDKREKAFALFAMKNKPPVKYSEATNSVVWEKLSEIEDSKTVYVDQEKLKAYEVLAGSKNIVWYDFEGFSLPFAPIDNVKPYHQIVFQVSVIQTNEDKEIYKENLVLDPYKMTSADFIKVSRAIYKKDAEKYVVYNKAYELTRLKEMEQILSLEHSKDLEEFSMHYAHIKENTVDLCDLFVIYSPNKLPAIMLYDQKARYSIKNVEKHITANHIQLPRPITPYKELKVKNGTAAMEEGINRALYITGDREWQIKVKDLQKYCENDVRAMIMVYDYVTYLLKKSGDHAN